MQYNLEKPVLVKKGAIGLKAIEKWKRKTYLKNKFNNVLINVEHYKSEKDLQMSKAKIKQVRFNDYINNLHNGWYIADCCLENLDISKDILEDLFNDNRPEEAAYHSLFLGKDTKSGCHLHVDQDFVIHQIVGNKIVYLLDFEQLEPRSLFSRYNNFSKKNFFTLDEAKYKITRVELEPGDMLFIPPWTWHAVENVGYSIAVTKAFDRNKDYLNEKRFKKLKTRNKLQKIIDFFSNLY